MKILKNENIYFMCIFLIFFVDGHVGIDDAGSCVFTPSATYFGRPSTILGSYTATLSTNGSLQQSAIGIQDSYINSTSISDKRGERLNYLYQLYMIYNYIAI